VLVGARDPSAARDFRQDSAGFADQGFAQDPPGEFGTDDGGGHEAVLGGHVAFGGQNSHTRRNASACGGAVDLAGTDRHGRACAERLACAVRCRRSGDGACEQTKGDVAPVRQGRMMKAQLRCCSVRDFHAQPGEITRLMGGYGEAKGGGVNDRQRSRSYRHQRLYRR